MQYFLFTLLGFVLGSTLFAYWIPKLLKNIDICTLPDDHNPGVSNAFIGEKAEISVELGSLVVIWYRESFQLKALPKLIK